MKISVDLSSGSYDIIIERGAIKEISKYIRLDRKVLVVTDTGVPQEYSLAVAAQCKSATVLTLPQGEQSKNIDSFQIILKKMLDAGFTRNDCVVAVGGGVVGDVSGFSSSCYMRGVDFYNVPTTLLSQLDSSIGGKTAIDFCGVKNIVGSFHQPKRVVIDPETLSTLDDRQLRAGLAEAIKMAATFDEELFEFIEKSTNIRDDVDEIICRSLKIKRDVVEKDPLEKRLRKVLNFGHTIGHAIESGSGGTLLHGECVAMGMLPMCSPTARSRIEALLKKCGLETEIKASADELLPFMLHDKKMQNSAITAVYVEKIGDFVLCRTSAEEILKNI